MFTVLLADDEPLVLEGLKFMVDWQGHGFEVCGEACDGEDALRLIRERKPDLVVTDIRMPVLDGLRLIEQCAADPGIRSRFVILSGHDDFNLARTALQRGVINYWLKPIDTDEIHQTLRKLRAEWSERKKDSAEPGNAAESPQGMALPAEADALYAAEDALQDAVEHNDGDRIRTAAEGVCRQLARSYADPAWQRFYISNVLLELEWKTADACGGTPEQDSGLADSPAFVQSDVSAWPEPLAACCLEVAGRLARQRAKAGPAGEAVRFVRRHYMEPLQLQAVAKALHFQPAYLGQLFKKHVGMPFLDYLHRTRIEEARKLLRRTDLKVVDVARAVGYADPEQFSAKFKQYMHMLPSQFKKS